MLLLDPMQRAKLSLPACAETTRLRVSADRIAADIEALRSLTIAGRPYTRRAFTPMYDDGRSWLTAAMAAAGLATTVDAAGNLVGRRPAARTAALDDDRGAAGVIAIGSHIDTVPDGGAYDGIAGVVAGLEVARTFADAGVELPIALEVIDFLAEEPNDFGVSCVGSRGMVGHLSEADLDRRDPSGTRLADAIRSVGGRPKELGPSLRKPGSLNAYLELHIEQGRVLERAGRPAGIVTTIVGIRRYAVQFIGAPSHAGTTAMGERRDALAAAAEMILAVEKLACAQAQDGYFVGTVGCLTTGPNAANVVPGTAETVVELRAEADAQLDDVQRALEAEVSAIGDRRGLSASVERVSLTLPVPMDVALRATLADAADVVDCRTCDLPSGAGHDAGHVAALAPAAMIFIPCLEGLSHAPGESASPQDIATGADVLTQAVLAVAAKL